MDEDRGGFEELVAALGVSVLSFSGWRAVRSGVFVGRLGPAVVAGLLGARPTVGDLAAFAVVLLAEGTVRGFGASLAVVLLLGGAFCSTMAFPLPFKVLVPFTGSACAGSAF